MDIKNYSLFELQQIEGLSIRAYNICLRHGLNDLSSVIKYFKKHKNFLGLESSGRITDQELTLLCQIYDDVSIEADSTFDENTRFPILKPLSRLQSKTLDHITWRELYKLSQRGQNCLNALFQSNVTFELIYRNFIEGKNEIEINIPNSGVKTESELISFIKELHQQYFYVLELSEEVLRLEVYKGWLFRNYKLSASDFHFFEQSFLENRFPLFRFIDYLFRNGKILPERSALIFERRSGYFNGIAVETMEDLASILNLTRERVRQITEKSVEKFDEAFSKLAEQRDLLRDITAYKWEYDNDLILTYNAYAEEINELESVSFKAIFFTRILSFLIHDTHLLWHVNKKSDQIDFLIKRELFNAFDFSAFVEDMFTQLEMDIRQDYDLRFEGYLVSFFKAKEFDLLARISESCQTIILQVFADLISFDFEGNLTFHRNTLVNVSDYAIEVLTNERSPMSIHEIHARIKNNHPHYHGGIDNLRSYLNRGKDVFIFFGRKSTYGLREWEGNLEGIKGGTIRSIVEEYLEQFDVPKYMSEILSYTLRFRPETNEKSLMSNLYLEQNKRFKDFGYGFWGLSDKKYDHENLNFRGMPPSTNRQIFSLLKKTGGMPFDQLLAHICLSLQLEKVQVDYQLRKLITKGRLSLSENGIVNFLQA